MATMFGSLAASFDQELKDKERDMTQAHALLGNIQSEILESQRVVGQLKTQAQSYEGVQEQLRVLECKHCFHKYSDMSIRNAAR